MVQPAPSSASTGLRISSQAVMRVPVSLVRYFQPIAENGPPAELVRLGRPGMPQDHVLHHTLSP